MILRFREYLMGSVSRTRADTRLVRFCVCVEKVAHQEMNCHRVCSRCSGAHWNTEPKWSLEPSSLRSAQVTEIPKSILCVAHVSHTHLWSPEDSLGCESVFEVGSRVHCCIHLCTLLAPPHISPPGASVSGDLNSGSHACAAGSSPRAISRAH